MRNAAALGQIELIDKFINLTEEQLEEGVNGDDEI
jgi:hypothetical protein